MMIHEFHTGEAAWRGLLNRPEARVMSSLEERELLVELCGTRQCILDEFPVSPNAEWSASTPQSEFQQVVRGLASADETFDRRAIRLQRLARRYQELRSKLAMANVRLIAHVAKRYLDRGVSQADLIQEGFCALLLAIDRFDLANETRLATYAIWWIRQAIQRAVASGAYPVRLNPRQLHWLAQSQASISAPGGGRGDARPATTETIDRLLAATRPAISLDARAPGDDATALVDLLTPRRHENHEPDDASERVHHLVAGLDAREQVVLKLRYGLGGEQKRTLVQIGRVLGVSKERVRQLQERALKKIRTSAVGDTPRGRLETVAPDGPWPSLARTTD